MYDTTAIMTALRKRYCKPLHEDTGSTAHLEMHVLCWIYRVLCSAKVCSSFARELLIEYVCRAVMPKRQKVVPDHAADTDNNDTTPMPETRKTRHAAATAAASSSAAARDGSSKDDQSTALDDLTQPVEFDLLEFSKAFTLRSISVPSFLR